MAIGDDATSAGFPLVPDTGEEGRVRWGAREINRTRDLVAQTRALIPVGKSTFREKSGISFGEGDVDPNTLDEGDIYLRII